jgi:hypothetical protein
MLDVGELPLLWVGQALPAEVQVSLAQTLTPLKTHRSPTTPNIAFHMTLRLSAEQVLAGPEADAADARTASSPTAATRIRGGDGMKV